MKIAAAVCIVMLAFVCQADAGWVPCWTFNDYRHSVSRSFSSVYSKIYSVSRAVDSANGNIKANKDAIYKVNSRVGSVENLVRDLSSKMDRVLQDVSALASRVAIAEQKVKKVDLVNPCAIGENSSNMFMCMLLSAPTTVQA